MVNNDLTYGNFCILSHLFSYCLKNRKTLIKNISHNTKSIFLIAKQNLQFWQLWVMCL